MKKVILVVALVLAGGLIAFAANYTVSGLSFNGYMTGPGDTDWLTLGGQEGTNPNICISHQPGVDFDIEVYNDGQMVCRNDGMETYSCCRANTPGRAQVKVWSHSGSGNYTITIQP
jgi:hypothetical protein